MTMPSLINLRTFWREFAPLTSTVSLGSSLQQRGTSGASDIQRSAQRQYKPTKHGACRSQEWRRRAASATAGSSSLECTRGEKLQRHAERGVPDRSLSGACLKPNLFSSACAMQRKIHDARIPFPASMYAPSGVAAPPRARATPKVIRLLAATFNAGNAEPSADLSPWIPRNGEGYDVIVVGTQECTWSGKAHKSKKKDDGGDSSDEDLATPHVVSAGGVTSGNAATPSAAAVAGDVPSAVPSEAASVPHPASGSAPQPPATPLLLASPKAPQASLFAAAERGLAGGGVKGALAGVGSYLSGQPTLSASCDFFRVVSHHVGPDFTLVQSLLMWQIGIEVFVRNELYPFVSAVESGSEATGLLGLTPNKVRCAELDRDQTWTHFPDFPGWCRCCATHPRHVPLLHQQPPRRAHQARRAPKRKCGLRLPCVVLARCPFHAPFFCRR